MTCSHGIVDPEAIVGLARLIPERDHDVFLAANQIVKTIVTKCKAPFPGFPVILATEFGVNLLPATMISKNRLR
jgi:hypothetical protein